MEKEKLTKTINIRVTEEEYEFFDQYKNKSKKLRKIIQEYIEKEAG